MQATYFIDTYALRGKPWREVVTVGEPYSRTFYGGPSWNSVLPLQRWARHTDSRQATFECRGRQNLGQPSPDA